MTLWPFVGTSGLTYEPQTESSVGCPAPRMRRFPLSVWGARIVFLRKTYHFEALAHDERFRGAVGAVGAVDSAYSQPPPPAVFWGMRSLRLWAPDEHKRPPLPYVAAIPHFTLFSRP